MRAAGLGGLGRGHAQRADALAGEKNPYEQGRAQYLFIADKPVFSATLQEGGRQFTLPAIWLYGRAEPFTPFFQWPYPREYLYSVPLELGEWSDDALVVLEPMVAEGANEAGTDIGAMLRLLAERVPAAAYQQLKAWTSRR